MIFIRRSNDSAAQLMHQGIDSNDPMTGLSDAHGDGRVVSQRNLPRLKRNETALRARPSAAITIALYFLTTYFRKRLPRAASSHCMQLMKI
jgi:hypothetical protein